MSSVVISGDTSGTVSLTVPAVAGTNTATLPAATGTVMVSGNMPAFSAYSNVAPQSVSSGVPTKVSLNSENFDTNNNFDSTTNYRFTPTVAGYYQFNFSVYPYTLVNYTIAYLYKNGSNVTFNQFFGSSTSASGSTLIYMNGTTDYVELYAQLQGITPSIYGRADLTYLNGSLVRAA